MVHTAVRGSPGGLGNTQAGGLLVVRTSFPDGLDRRGQEVMHSGLDGEQVGSLMVPALAVCTDVNSDRVEMRTDLHDSLLTVHTDLH